MPLATPQRMLFPEGGIGGISPNPRKPVFLDSPGGLESRRHPRGFPEPVGSILVEYEPKPSHMDLIRTRFHDFCPNSGILVYDQHTMSLCGRHRMSLCQTRNVSVADAQCLCGRHTVSLCGRHTGQMCGAGGARIFWSHTQPTIHSLTHS